MTQQQLSPADRALLRVYGILIDKARQRRAQAAQQAQAGSDGPQAGRDGSQTGRKVDAKRAQN